MGFVGSMFNSGMGAGFQGGSADITNPFTQQQTSQSYKDVLEQQKAEQAFVNALAAQNGIGNQSSVFNQLQGVANGTGPNPAQAQLAQATGNNIAAQNALMAGQRGSSANAGLIARQAAMQGGNTLQNSAGQAASLQANQSLGALNQLGGLSSQQVAQQQAAQQSLSGNKLQEQANLLNAVAGWNNAKVGMQSNVNNANASIAGINAQQQGHMLNGGMNALSGSTVFGSLFNKGGMVKGYADGGQIFEPAAGPMSQLPNLGSFIGQPIMGVPQVEVPSIGSYGSPSIASIHFPNPQESSDKKKGQGGEGSGGVSSPFQGEVAGGPGDSGGGSGDFFNGAGMSDFGSTMMANKGGMAYADGGQVEVPGIEDSGSINIPSVTYQKPQEGLLSKAMSSMGGGGGSGGGGGMGSMAMLAMASQGGKVGGKADVKGDSPKNDTVPAMLSPGEIVIPRTIAQHPDAPALAAEFVKEQLEKHKKMNCGGTVQKYADGGIATQDYLDRIDPPAQQNFPTSSVDQYDPRVMAQQIPAIPVNPMVRQAFPNAFQDKQQIKNRVAMAPEGSVPQAPAAPQAQMGDPYGINTQYGLANLGLNQQLGALKGIAGTSQAQAALESKAYEQQLQQQQAAQKIYEQHYNDLTAQREKYKASYMSQEPDPNRFVHSLSTGQKIMTTIGLILGGLGSGGDPSKNTGLQMLNKQIDNDIDAQKQELGKKHNLLAENFQDFNNLDHATAVTRMNYNDQAASTLGLAAAKYKGTQAGLNAQLAQGQLLQQNAQIMGQLASEKTQMDMAGQGGRGSSLPAWMDPAADRRVEMSGQVFHTTDKETADKVRGELESIDNISNTLNKVEKFNSEGWGTGTSYPGTARNGMAKILNRELEEHMADAAAKGGQIGRLINQFDELKGSAGGFSQSESAGKIQALRESLAERKKNLIKNQLIGGSFVGLPSLGKK